MSSFLTHATIIEDSVTQEAKLTILPNSQGRLTSSGEMPRKDVAVEDEGVNKPLLEGQDEEAHESDDQDRLANRVRNESSKLWRIIGPTIVHRVTSYATIIVSQAFGGHIGTTELAAVSIAYNVILGFEFGLLLGMASALETLCGQAFGAKKYHMLGVYMQRCWIVLIITCVIMLPLIIFTAPILEFLGQTPEVARFTGVVTLWVIPMHFCFAFIFPLQRFLQSQSKTAILPYVSVVVLFVHVLITWLLVNVWNLGLMGIGIGLSVSWWLMALAILSYIVCGGCPHTWSGFTMDAFSGLWDFAKLSVGSGIMLCLENWYYRVLILVTGNLKDAEIALDALSICFSINSWQMMIPLAFLAGVGVRVANELGAGNGKAAKFATLVGVYTSLGIGILCWLLILIFNDQIALAFTSNEAVLQVTRRLKVLLAFTILLNSVQPVLSGVAVGLGWQAYVAYINLACYYLIGVPLGYLLGWYFDLGVVGIWIGMLLGGMGIQTLILGIIVIRCQWEQEAARARQLIEKWDDNNKNSTLEQYPSRLI